MKPIYIFSILFIYIMLQFAWWSYLLVKLNTEVYQHKIENVRLRSTAPGQTIAEEKILEKKLHEKWWMVMGEGGVFISLLLFGTILTLRSFNKEMALARQQKNFLLSITHEFKSPLASIKLYLQTLLKHDLDKEKKVSFISSAIDDADRLNNLVENALLANMIDYKGYAFHKEEVNLSALVRLLVQKFQSTPGAKNKTTAVIGEDITMHADKVALGLMLNNLLENASKYSTENTLIHVNLQRLHDKTILSVADGGAGIPDAEKTKVFEKFYRLGKEETRTTKGTGLGLYIVKYIVEHHNGKITVRDNSPKGSVFEIVFS
ncbi:MAG: HAMP domain-containing sensor histidine kinase [Bacteroidetes bacterium]|nr:HAMP domain-containing sensor histidine kinase [Bacteroidota bacterium]